MDNIIDIFNKKKEYIESLLDKEVKVTLKIDGKPFQVCYNKENDEIEYHGRSGNSIKLGPLLTEYDLIFSTGLNKGIKHFEKYKDKLKKYDFICCEVSDGDEIYLISVIENNKYIDGDKLNFISKEIGLDTIPVLFDGKLKDSIKEEILSFIKKEISPESKEFKDWIIKLFNLSGSNIKEINSLEEFEGIVLNFIDENKTIQYKLIDPILSKRRDERNQMLHKENEEHKEAYDEAYKLLYELVKKHSGKYDNDHWKNINIIFEKICDNKTDYNKLIETGGKLITNTRYRCFIQKERLSQKLQDLLKDNTSLLNIYETYIKMFWKEKPRAFVISKEFQNNVNNLIKNLKELYERT